jgi:hypothetical protein
MPPFKRGGYAAGALLLLAGCGMLACNETVGPRTVESGSGSVPSPEFELSVDQRQFFARPVTAEAAAGRPATPQDLREVQDWFASGEWQALLAVANRRAAARGDDTLPHCIPLCGRPAAAGK